MEFMISNLAIYYYENVMKRRVTIYLFACKVEGARSKMDKLVEKVVFSNFSLLLKKGYV